MKITRKLAVSAILLAFDVIFSRVVALNAVNMKIGIGFAAIAVCAMLFGPWWAALVSALGDFIGAIAFPTGAYFPGFTVTAAITGLIYGALLYRKEVTWLRSLIASALNSVFVSWMLNTMMIAVWFSTKSYWVLLGTRAIQLAIILPLQFAVIRALGASKAIKKEIAKWN